MYMPHTPETVMRMHRLMLEAEMARNRHRKALPANPNRPIGGLRDAIGGSLIALGARLASPMPAAKPTAPAYRV